MKRRAVPGAAEKRLRESLACGLALDLRTGSPDADDVSGGAEWAAERQVRAELIADLVRQGDAEAGSVLSLAGARVVGALDLRHAQIRRPLMLRDCYFDEPPDLSEANAVSVDFAGSRLPSLTCYGLRLERDLDLSGVDSGRIDLFGVHVSGRIWLQAAHVRSPGDGWALNAPDLTVDGGMYCRGVYVDGGLNIYGATIGSTLELVEARLSNPGGTALRAPGITVRFDMSCAGCAVAGMMNLFGAQIGGQLWLGSAQLDSGGPGWALSAPQMKVSGGVYCNNGFSATGGVNFFIRCPNRRPAAPGRRDVQRRRRRSAQL